MPNIEVINWPRINFARNKDRLLFPLLIKANSERTIFLNTRYNIIEVFYFSGSYENGQEQWNLDFFGANYEMLDILLEKYQSAIAGKLARFCLSSKSKSYWEKLKSTQFLDEIMIELLGGKK